MKYYIFIKDIELVGKFDFFLHENKIPITGYSFFSGIYDTIHKKYRTLPYSITYDRLLIESKIDVINMVGENPYHIIKNHYLSIPSLSKSFFIEDQDSLYKLIKYISTPPSKFDISHLKIEIS